MGREKERDVAEMGVCADDKGQIKGGRSGSASRRWEIYASDATGECERLSTPGQWSLAGVNRPRKMMPEI